MLGFSVGFCSFFPRHPGRGPPAVSGPPFCPGAGRRPGSTPARAAHDFDKLVGDFLRHLFLHQAPQPSGRWPPPPAAPRPPGSGSPPACFDLDGRLLDALQAHDVGVTWRFSAAAAPAPGLPHRRCASRLHHAAGQAEDALAAPLDWAHGLPGIAVLQILKFTPAVRPSRPASRAGEHGVHAGCPSFWYFLPDNLDLFAVQGITDTTNRSAGSIPSSAPRSRI